jgi:hypothetical protein
MDEKSCNGCMRALAVEAFATRERGGRIALQHHCRECQSKYRRNHYLVNRTKYLDKAKQNRRTAVVAVHRAITRHLLSHPCPCGESDPVVLEFDHVRGEKSFNISDAARWGWSMERVFEEVAKCDVLCANCHRRKTAKQLGWYAAAEAAPMDRKLSYKKSALAGIA